MKAKIFDIQRGSFVDGPGIRTTVFFKGCNLRCEWCHNPEGQNFETEMMVYKDLCTNCGTCKRICKFGLENCDYCGECVTYCPNDARAIAGKDFSVEEVLDVILKDKSYFDNSGGGVTFSGGECMLQIDFLTEILKKCKENNVHTAIDTCGNVSFDSFKKVIPYTDLFLYDIKCITDSLHKRYCKDSNELILSNLKKLKNYCDNEICVRIPVIPSFNDDEKEQRLISDFLKNIKIDNIEYLKYHKMGINKYYALNRIPKIFN